MNTVSIYVDTDKLYPYYILTVHDENVFSKRHTLPEGVVSEYLKQERRFIKARNALKSAIDNAD